MVTATQLKAAKASTAEQLQPGDAEKWAQYHGERAKGYEPGRDWITANGYAEYVRLNQLSFWGYIDPPAGCTCSACKPKGQQ